jgi:YfiH family protein
MGILRSALLDDAGFRHGFAERSEGADAVARTLGVSRVVQVKQVHGGRTIDASEVSEVSPQAEADAVVSRSTGGPWAVGVRVADCVPVLVADADSGDVVAIHAGWRGVVAGVVRGAIAQLEGRNLLAAIGPCIGRCCFEVDRSVAEAIAGASGGAAVVARWDGDKAWVDLRAAVRAQLTTLDSKNVRVDDVAGCTKHEPSRFHSFRRDGERSGRMLAAIRARPPS